MKLVSKQETNDFDDTIIHMTSSHDEQRNAD